MGEKGGSMTNLAIVAIVGVTLMAVFGTLATDLAESVFATIKEQILGGSASPSGMAFVFGNFLGF